MPDTDIQITEFMYDAPNTAPSDIPYEWAELLNTGTTPVSLNGWTLSDAVGTSDAIGAFSLAAGQYAILFNDSITQAQFEAVYGPIPPGAVVIPVSGWRALNNTGDTVTLANSGGTAIESFTYPDVSSNGNSVETGGTDGAETFTEDTSPTPGAVCFGAGTLIATSMGETAVEALQIGDLIRTSEGDDVPVLWVGRQIVQTTRAAQRMEPVRIAKDALGGGLPHSDLTVTADHGMVLDGYVINASALVNGSTITWVPMSEQPATVTYYHIETPEHDVILANGAASETYLDARDRSAFDNFQEYQDLYGVERIIPELPFPRITASRLLPACVKERLKASQGGDAGYGSVAQFLEM